MNCQCQYRSYGYNMAVNIKSFRFSPKTYMKFICKLIYHTQAIIFVVVLIKYLPFSVGIPRTFCIPGILSMPKRIIVERSFKLNQNL